jgi:alpha-L-fucosidase
MELMSQINSLEEHEMDKRKRRYTEEWESLKQHATPEWIMDGKFGIYTHWTPVTVATKDNHGDWYGYSMYQSDYTLGWNGEIIENKPSKAYEYHVKRFGNPDQFGYKDMIKLFQPKKFNADEWASLFEKSGARFAGPVAIHHDNFAMWDSDVSRWNIMNNLGFDAVGELMQAIKSRGMKFVTTFHHSFSWYFFNESYRFDGRDIENADLYGEPHDRSDPPSEQFEELWYKKLDEVMLKYEPDLIWFDFCFEFISARNRKKFMTRYYNLADEWGKAVGVCYKIKANPPIPPQSGILDFELGRSDKPLSDFWMTDTSIGPWFYQDQMRDGSGLKSADEIITMLIDIVSKNGCLLLNIPPDNNGEIIEPVKKTLLSIGSWLEINGEAIYETRPWKIYGEGPTMLDKPQGGFNEKKGFKYAEGDIRYTRSKDCHTIYASILAKPEEQKKVVLRAFSRSVLLTPIFIEKISMLGCDGELSWTLQDDGLSIVMPAHMDHPYTVVVKIKVSGNVMDVETGTDFVEDVV